MAQAQFVFSNGITEYSLMAGAIIITVILLFVQNLVAALSFLPLRYYALSYVPSCLMLALISAINEQMMLDFTTGIWCWISASVLLLYIVSAIVINRLSDKNTSIQYPLRHNLYPNYIILFFLLLATGSVSNSNDVYNYELKTERLIQKKQYNEASKVGIKSLRASKRLTQLRMYALSCQDSLADCLFDYPQLYGSEGLLDIYDTVYFHRVKSTDICLHLGAFCGKSIKTSRRYLDVMLQDTVWNRHTVDYYLCSLLLDKNLNEFYKELPKYYNLSDTIPNAYDALPRSYKEALMLMSDNSHAQEGKIIINGDSLATLSDTMFSHHFKEYNSLKSELPDMREQINKTHREYGHTFWWYYEFSNKANGELMIKKKE